jgi:hypothetical protein
MWNTTDSDEDGRDDDATPPDLGAVREPEAYWRRRFFILGGGVAVLGLCAWLLPGSHQAAARTSVTAQASMAALARQGDLPAAAYGSAWPGPTPKETAKASAVETPAKRAARAHPGASPSPGPTVTAPTVTAPTVTASGGTARGAAAGSRCTPSDIVLSLFTGQSSYGRAALPQFDVYAVSTSSSACTLGYGPGSVQVIVTRRGRVVWDSAACKPPAAARVRFILGVPQVLTFAWNRRAKEPSGCAGSLSADAWGTFDAVAMMDGQSSPVHPFKLSG